MTQSTEIPKRLVAQVILRNPVNGRIQGLAKRSETQAKEDFWKRIRRTSEDECWEWSGGKTSKQTGRNYGVVWINGERWKTHRLAWVYEFGPIPRGMNVCHKCDNPPCCNPSHLFIGTTKDNVADCLAKGRGNKERGIDRYNATLTEEDVREIRSRYKARTKDNSGRALAKEFGVGTTMISAIVCRNRWKHI